MNPPGLGQIALNVSDVTVATDFYRDVLGLQFLFSAGPGLSFFNVSGVRLMIAALDNPQQAGQNSTFYYKVPDLDAAFAELSTKAKVEHDPQLIAPMPDHELWMAFFRDPDGNLFGLMEERPK